jgi:hypothetical protein
MPGRPLKAANLGQGPPANSIHPGGSSRFHHACVHGRPGSATVDDLRRAIREASDLSVVGDPDQCAPHRRHLREELQNLFPGPWIVWRISNEQRSDETWFLHPYGTVPVILAYGAVSLARPQARRVIGTGGRGG